MRLVTLRSWEESHAFLPGQVQPVEKMRVPVGGQRNRRLAEPFGDNRHRGRADCGRLRLNRTAANHSQLLLMQLAARR
jgi:hypothetical protein